MDPDERHAGAKRGNVTRKALAMAVPGSSKAFLLKNHAQVSVGQLKESLCINGLGSINSGLCRHGYPPTCRLSQYGRDRAGEGASNPAL